MAEKVAANHKLEQDELVVSAVIFFLMEQRARRKNLHYQS